MELIDAREEEKQELQQELVRFAKKHKLRRKLISAVIIIAVFFSCIAAAWLIGNIKGKERIEAANLAEIEKLNTTIQEKDAKINELINTPIVVNPIAPEIVLDIVSSELRDIGELATVEYIFTDAARFTDSKQIAKWNWNIPGTEKAFTAKWDGKIKAGIHINQVKVDVDENNFKIIITLPAAEILSYEVDSTSIQILDEKNNLFNPISTDDKVQLDIKTEEAMKERAIENGLLEMAQKNAESIIASLLCVNPDITSDYTIEFVKE